MGTIRTTGSAAREAAYDRMTVTMKFNSKEQYSKDAANRVINECEDLLEKLKELGVDIASILGGPDRIDSNTRIDEKYKEAIRQIRWETDYSLKQMDILTQIVRNGSYDVVMNIVPRFSGEDEMRKELKKQAAIEAKKTAEEYAEALGTKVKGPSKIDIDDDDDYIKVDHRGYTDVDISNMRAKELRYQDTMFSSLRVPTTILKETMTIEWELEM